MDRLHAADAKPGPVVRIHTTYTCLVNPIHLFVKLSLPEPQPPPVWQYLQSDMYHKGVGFDRLLFVFGLLLSGEKSSGLIRTINVFTIAHSITLAPAALHFIKVSGSFTEAAIEGSEPHQIPKKYKFHG